MSLQSSFEISFIMIMKNRIINFKEMLIPHEFKTNKQQTVCSGQFR